MEFSQSYATSHLLSIFCTVLGCPCTSFGPPKLPTALKFDREKFDHDFAGVRAECAHPGVRAECAHPARAANGPILACLTDTAACSTDKNDF